MSNLSQRDRVVLTHALTNLLADLRQEPGYTLDPRPEDPRPSEVHDLAARLGVEVGE